MPGTTEQASCERSTTDRGRPWLHVRSDVIPRYAFGASGTRSRYNERVEHRDQRLNPAKTMAF